MFKNYIEYWKQSIISVIDNGQDYVSKLKDKGIEELAEDLCKDTTFWQMVDTYIWEKVEEKLKGE